MTLGDQLKINIARFKAEKAEEDARRLKEEESRKTQHDESVRSMYHTFMWTINGQISNGLPEVKMIPLPDTMWVKGDSSLDGGNPAAYDWVPYHKDHPDYALWAEFSKWAKSEGLAVSVIQNPTYSRSSLSPEYVIKIELSD